MWSPIAFTLGSCLQSLTLGSRPQSLTLGSCLQSLTVGSSLQSLTVGSSPQSLTLGSCLQSQCWSFSCCTEEPFWALLGSLVVFQSLSCVWLSATLWTAACQTSLFFTISWSFAQTRVHQVGDAIQPSCPLSSPSPAFNLSQHQILF